MSVSALMWVYDTSKAIGWGIATTSMAVLCFLNFNGSSVLVIASATMSCVLMCVGSSTFVLVKCYKMWCLSSM